MTRLKFAVAAGLCLSLALTMAAGARPHHPPPTITPPLPCCTLRAGTIIAVELDEHVSTKIQRTGDTFALRLAAPVIVNGMVVLRAGTPGVGEVVSAAKPGMGGRPAKLVLAARYLTLRRGRVALEGLQLAAAGKDNSTSAQAVGLTGIAFGPLGFMGLAVKGGDVDFLPGTGAEARLSDDATLPPLARATRADYAEAEDVAAADAPSDVQGAIDVPPPPRDMGQVVFFRPKSLLGTGQWFNVRENGQALGKLSNGAYFIQAVQPGDHTYSVSEEPEIKDKLTLEVDVGETYYVEGAITKGLVIGTADLTPSTHAAFAKASKDLKPAPPPGQSAQGDKDDLSKYPNDTASNASR